MCIPNRRGRKGRTWFLGCCGRRATCGGGFLIEPLWLGTVPRVRTPRGANQDYDGQINLPTIVYVVSPRNLFRGLVSRLRKYSFGKCGAVLENVRSQPSCRLFVYAMKGCNPRSPTAHAHEHAALVPSGPYLNRQAWPVVWIRARPMSFERHNDTSARSREFSKAGWRPLLNQ